MSALYRNVANPKVVVRLLHERAEFRVAELRRWCVIYERDGKIYVRDAGEFFDKFSPIPGDSNLTGGVGCKTPIATKHA